MKNELKSIALKSVKLAGATCIAAGAIAFVASGAAVKAVTAGGKYLKETAKKILEEEPEVTIHMENEPKEAEPEAAEEPAGDILEEPSEEQ